MLKNAKKIDVLKDVVEIWEYFADAELRATKKASGKNELLFSSQQSLFQKF